MRRRDVDVGGIVLGIVILSVGLYYFAQRTLGLTMPDLDWDKIWPIIVIAVGAAIVLSAWLRRGAPGSRE